MNGSKSWLIVKNEEIAESARELFGDSVNITKDGKQHLGAVIGSASYKKEYCEEKVENWIKELTTLCEFAESQPQAAYAAYTKGYRSKFTFFLRTIEGFEEHLDPIDELLDTNLIPTLFGDRMPKIPRDVLALNPNEGGIGIPVVRQEAKAQFDSSLKLTQHHIQSIIEQAEVLQVLNEEGKTSEDIKTECRKMKNEGKKEQIKQIDEQISVDLKACIDQARDKGASSWLNTLPIEEQQLNLNKEQFRDALHLRYNIPLAGLPSYCPCGERFDVNHALSCKKGGFVSQRHDNLRDLLTHLLSKICKDVEAEPHLIPVTTEQMRLRTANTNDESRLDMKAKGFWQRGQTAFFDLRVTHVNAPSSCSCSDNYKH